jgi:ATP-dependent Clp protease ATP-binding subunit ClpC
MINELNFNLEETSIYQAVKQYRNPVFKMAGFLGKSLLILFSLSLGFFLFLFISNKGGISNQSLFLGLSLILLSFSLIFSLIGCFFNSKIKKPSLNKNVSLGNVLESPEKYNLADFIDFDLAKAISTSIIFSRKKNIYPVNSSILFYSLINENKDLDFIFFRALLNRKEIETKLKKEILKLTDSGSRSSQVVYSENFYNSILLALKSAVERGRSRIESGDAIIGLAKHNQFFKDILIENNLKVEGINNLVRWLENIKAKIKEQKEFWQKKNLAKKGSLGKEWAAGYTPALDKFSIDLSEVMRRKGFPEIIGHQKEIEAMERTLSREEKNNVLIVGDSGSGRKSMIYGLVNKSALGESLPEINYKRIVELDLSKILAQTFSNEEVEFTLDGIFKEIVSAGNVILVVDNFHNFAGSRNKPGTIDVSSVLFPYLGYSSFQIVAISTFEGFHKYIEQNSSVFSLFEKVESAEISEEETLLLLEKLTPGLEKRYHKFISYPALRDIISYCSKYLTAITFPEKAIDLLYESMAHLSQKKDKVLLSEHVALIVSEKTQIPVGKIEEKEKEVLLNLEKLIHERIVGQEEAVREISMSLRRARAEVTTRKGPMGTFLFLGPTGVGKTETSKALAEIYFNSEEKMIRLDMSEFQSINDIPRLIGSPGEEGLLTTQVRKRPFSLILLDEIEKAHPNILNLFLQVLDEGHLTDGLGRKVDFKNSIIIATSNAGYKTILAALKEEKDWSELKQELLDRLFEEGIFRPEFINRFDAMVVFKPLTKENLLMIAELMLKSLAKNLRRKEIEFVINQPIKEKIVELGYNPTFGARRMKRVIQDKIENVFASAILSGQIKRGSRVEINPENFQIKI